MAKDVKNQNKPMYQVHCTECGELIENKFFPLNQLLKQYYLGPQSQERIAEIVDFLGVGALYGQAVLPEVPAFVDQDGRWNFNKPVSFAQNAPAEFTCSDNAIPKYLLVDVNLNVASMVAQFCMITGFEDIYPMLKLRHEMDAKLRDYQDPSEEQNTRWREYCNKISWIPGVKIDALLTPDKRYNLIGVLMSDILNFAEQEAKIPGRCHFAAQKLKIGWRYREENQRKMPVALVVRGESKGSFDALDCCCDKCRRPLLWDMGAYPQKVIGILNGLSGENRHAFVVFFVANFRRKPGPAVGQSSASEHRGHRKGVIVSPQGNPVAGTGDIPGEGDLSYLRRMNRLIDLLQSDHIRLPRKNEIHKLQQLNRIVFFYQTVGI